jgi:hypothetical protein
LYVRYRDVNETLVTVTINSLESIENGNGTYTAGICVSQNDSYSSPVCVQGGIEIFCPDPWIPGDACTTNGQCLFTP